MPNTSSSSYINVAYVTPADQLRPADFQYIREKLLKMTPAGESVVHWLMNQQHVRIQRPNRRYWIIRCVRLEIPVNHEYAFTMDETVKISEVYEHRLVTAIRALVDSPTELDSILMLPDSIHVVVNPLSNEDTQLDSDE